jgi:hypothetical protein
LAILVEEWQAPSGLNRNQFFGLQFEAETEKSPSANPNTSLYGQRDLHHRNCCFVYRSHRVRPNEIQPHKIGAVPDAHAEPDGRAFASRENCAGVRTHANQGVANSLAAGDVHESERDTDPVANADVHSIAKRNSRTDATTDGHVPANNADTDSSEIDFVPANNANTDSSEINVVPANNGDDDAAATIANAAATNDAGNECNPDAGCGTPAD